MVCPWDSLKRSFGGCYKLWTTFNEFSAACRSSGLVFANVAFWGGLDWFRIRRLCALGEGHWGVHEPQTFTVLGLRGSGTFRFEEDRAREVWGINGFQRFRGKRVVVSALGLSYRWNAR